MDLSATKTPQTPPDSPSTPNLYHRLLSLPHPNPPPRSPPQDLRLVAELPPPVGRTPHLFRAGTIFIEGLEAHDPRAEPAFEGEIHVLVVEGEDWADGLDSSPVPGAGNEATLDLVLGDRARTIGERLEQGVELKRVTGRKTVDKCVRMVIKHSKTVKMRDQYLLERSPPHRQRRRDLKLLLSEGDTSFSFHERISDLDEPRGRQRPGH